jgi:hypothetical protein
MFGITELVNTFKKVFYIFQNINHKSYLIVQAVNVNNIYVFSHAMKYLERKV